MMNMTDSADVTAAQQQEAAPPGLAAADEQLVRELAERAREGGLKLTGQGGLLGQRTKREISVTRDRDASFDPKIVAKRQRRLNGAEEMVISLSAKGLTHGEISAHLAEIYGAEVSKQTISAITDKV